MKNTINKLVARIKAKAMALLVQAKTGADIATRKLAEVKGDFVMNHGVVFIIIIVVAVIVIAVLTAYVQGDFSSLLKGKVSDLFN